MPNVVGAIRNLCQNSSANKDAVREEGGIVGLVDLLKAGMESPAALKAAETLEVVLDNNAANEKATTSAILEQPQGREVLQSFNGLLERLQKEETARAVPPEAPADFYALAGAVRCHGAALADALPPSVGWCPPDEIQPTTVATVSCQQK